jgi:hypothetical protein
MRLAERGGSFDLWREPGEEIYSLADGDRLACECAKLDPQFEQQLADEGLAGDFRQWPAY